MVRNDQEYLEMTSQSSWSKGFLFIDKNIDCNDIQINANV